MCVSVHTCIYNPLNPFTIAHMCMPVSRDDYLELVNPGGNWFSIICVDTYFLFMSFHTLIYLVSTPSISCVKMLTHQTDSPKQSIVHSDPSQQNLNLFKKKVYQRGHSTNIHSSFLPNSSFSMTKACGFLLIMNQRQIPPHLLLAPRNVWEKTCCSPFLLGKDQKGDNLQRQSRSF